MTKNHDNKKTYNKNVMENVMKNMHGEVVSRRFEYTKNEKPTIVSYLYGSMKIVRPIFLVTKNGNLIERYEVAHKIINKPLTEKMLQYGEADKLKYILDFMVSDEEFDKLEKHIAKSPH